MTLAQKQNYIEKLIIDNSIQIDIVLFKQKLENLKFDLSLELDKEAYDLYLRIVRYTFIWFQIKHCIDNGNWSLVTELQLEFKDLSKSLDSDLVLCGKVKNADIVEQLLDHLKIQKHQPSNSDLLGDISSLRSRLSKQSEHVIFSRNWNGSDEDESSGEEEEEALTKSSEDEQSEEPPQINAGSVRSNKLSEEEETMDKLKMSKGSDKKGDFSGERGLRSIFDEQRFYQHDDREPHLSRSSCFTGEKQVLCDRECAQRNAVCRSNAQAPSGFGPGLVQYRDASGSEGFYFVCPK
jgi:hypothetical protein